ncbi:MAG TPA: cytochrome c3 family protein [Gemmatimonadales bacterium]|nr:cytochrome c3 family protein [Gemmatimonadales bacterium]
MKPVRPILGLAAVVLLGAAGGRLGRGPGDQFDHAKHAAYFPGCEGCHAGVLDSMKPIFPPAEVCTDCHDGTVKKRVEFTPPAPGIWNLRFTHARHLEEAGKKLPADSMPYCTACHTPAGGTWMEVRPPIPQQCFQCHGIRTAHFSAPDTACGICHYTLAQATELTTERIAHFDKPASHEDSLFPTAKGHGEAAKRSIESCAVCHARDFCAQCHVNAPEVKPIQALSPDPRSLALKAEVKAPASHSDARFLAIHNVAARRDISRCAFCHTQESCVTCHRAQPGVAAGLPVAGPGRAIGVQIQRKKPASHAADWAEHHAQVASASPKACTACHTRDECLQCHRPSAGATGTYHPAGWLTRHPAAAFTRQTDCSQCHNTGAFCTSCHKQAGLVSQGPLGPGGYHDSNHNFALNHGLAARQNLESCVACHSERDCLTCHSAQGARRFDPHGPGFDPNLLKQRNPQTCEACHGPNIP